MTTDRKTKKTVRSQQTNYVLEKMFHNLLILDINYPYHRQKKVNIDENENKTEQKHTSIIYALGRVQGLTNFLKFIKVKQKQNRRLQQRQRKYTYNIQNYIFCRPLINNLKDQKIYWILRNKKKKKLHLDFPKSVLILPNNYLITIQRKCINLYQIQQDLSISLKDFDSFGLGKEFKYTQIKTVNYKKKQYVLIFGNQQQNLKQITMVVVFKIVLTQLKFIKKSKIYDRQTISPTIIFENDLSTKQQQKFCLILGGYQNYNIFHYYALKIQLHLLVSQFLFYDVGNTQVIPFNNKYNGILSGKAINFKDNWYIFCSEQQTVNQIQLQYGGQNKTLISIDIKTAQLNFKQKVYFSQDNMHYIYENQEDKIIFVDKNLQIIRKQLNCIIQNIHN